MVENRQFEKRTEMAGSIICENGCVRLRVVRHGISLGVMLEAEDAEGNDVSLLHIPDEHLAPMAVTAGGAAHFRYVSFDPIEIHGETRGVRLSG